ncbi:hypothetical protein Acr_24g0008530 [Actinidia rufa]|uniref:Uncharacterized protein n=1 Tax=Actinidia rufa TaxID=165716 RepID=A0A7J0GV47_9ERIC|nr:hypothetical protein Acr_24g0008530 [Actinidia rufa]
MGPKRGRARIMGHGRGGHGATGRGTPIEDVGDQGVASQTQQGVDRGVISHSRRTQQGAGRGNPTPVVSEAHSGASGRETALDVPVIPSQFAREVVAVMLEMKRTRHEKIRIQREVTSARFREGMKEFRKMNPPSFDDLGDPVVAGHWLSQIHLVNTEAKKCKRFKNGLNPSFWLYVISQRIRNFSDLLDCARRVKPKNEQRKEFKGSWEPRQMSVGTSSTTSGSFSKKRQRYSTQESVGQQMFGASIPDSSSNPSNPGRISKSQIVSHQCNQPVEFGQCNNRVQDKLLIISKATNNRGTNHSSRVSQSLPSEDLEWRVGMLLPHPSSFQDKEGDMCRVRECREWFMQLLMQQQFHLRLSLL